MKHLMPLTAPFDINAIARNCLEPFTLNHLDGLTPAHRAKACDVVAAIRSFAVVDQSDRSTVDNYAPDFAVTFSDKDRFKSVELPDVPADAQSRAALAYTALRSDGRVETLAEREAERRKLEPSSGFEIIGLKGALVVTVGAFVHWPSERTSGAHIPKILADIRVFLPKGHSNHARIEALEGVSHYLTHRLHRAFDEKRKSPPEDWRIRVLAPA